MTVTRNPGSFLRNFKRSAKLTLYRTDVPTDDTKYKVNRAPGSENGIEIADLRIQFRLERALKKVPAPCTIRVTNLNADSRRLISRKPVGVSLEAGYDGMMKLLYTGDMTYVNTTQDGPDITTVIECGDGLRVYSNARARATYGKGTTLKKILRDLASNIGMELPPNIIQSTDLDQQVTDGMAVFGPVRNVFTSLLAPLGYTWTIQNGKLVILKESETDGDYLISEETGMIGFPEVGSPEKNGKPPTITVRCILFPELRAGSRVALQSKFINGSFKIERVVHQGDTHGSAWETEVELRQL